MQLSMVPCVSLGKTAWFEGREAERSTSTAITNCASLRRRSLVGRHTVATVRGIYGQLVFSDNAASRGTSTGSASTTSAQR
jgi:hypothetical protein